MSTVISDKVRECLVHQCGDAFGNPACGCLEKNISAALKEAGAQALCDVCDELVEKYEGQGKTMTTAVMHIRAKAAELRRTP